MSKKSAGTQPFQKPETYSCIIVRMAEMTGDKSNTINVLEAHRDEYLAQNPFGKKLVEEYYRSTSKWVDALEASSDAKNIATRGWTMLKGVAQEIEAKRFDEATKKFSAFTSYVNTL